MRAERKDLVAFIERDAKGGLSPRDRCHRAPAGGLRIKYAVVGADTVTESRNAIGPGGGIRVARVIALGSGRTGMAPRRNR
jgi:hypothetical protein